MRLDITTEALCHHGISETVARALVARLQRLADVPSASRTWCDVSRSILTRDLPFSVHLLLYQTVYNSWDHSQGPPPVWTPTRADIEGANITALCKTLSLDSYSELLAWSQTHRARFWQVIIETIGIPFMRPPSQTLDCDQGVESPRWLVDAKLNITESCFQAAGGSTAIIYQTEGGRPQRMTYDQLNALSNRVSNSLVANGFSRGDAVGIAMPMTTEAVAAYLGIVKAGCVVVSIADSFSAQEIGTRLRIAGAKAVITQDVIHRAGKTLPMYQRVVDGGAEMAVVIPAVEKLDVKVRDRDREWSTFLEANDSFAPVACDPSDAINILFSSGTTGDPKAIPWDHTTPIKCAMDGYIHQDIKAHDIVAWPTNIGWMMGPWLIFASLINHGTIALYYGAPGSREFCRFVQDSRVAMLGVVPSLVKAWRSADTVEGLDWSSIKVFSSTGEASNAEDYLYLMSLADYRPVIEYCGGTEIGGGYITGTVVQPASPATFSTPSLGLDLYTLDEQGQPSDNGEVFLVPPSIGLSTRLLNRDHHEVYFRGTPTGPRGEVLRRHGDQIERLGAGFFRAHGRADDTMNLSGIKVSSAEIERVVSKVAGIVETAAIAVSPADGGPSQLVIYAVLDATANRDQKALAKAMQVAIAKGLNPLFKIHDVRLIDSLPRTASNKVMRRVLRSQYTLGG